jgi:hypothetical protein
VPQQKTKIKGWSTEDFGGEPSSSDGYDDETEELEKLELGDLALIGGV